MQDGSFVILAAVEDSLFDEEKWEVGLKEFYDFVEAQMDFSIAVYMGDEAAGIRRRKPWDRHSEECSLILQGWERN